MKSMWVLAPVLCTTLMWAQVKPGSPVVTAARDVLQRQSKNLLEAAEEMPAEKYAFKPTPAQMSYGELMAHIAKSNDFLCAKLAGKPPAQSQVSEKDGRDKVVAALKASFDGCSAALTSLTDVMLADEVTLFGNRPGTKASALLALTNDWADHYGAAAIYLRLNGLLPPTAKKK